MSLRNLFSDLSFLAASGADATISSINKFGRNTTIASGATETIWDGSSAYSFPATALMTSMSQTADQAAMRGISIEIQGLDANWAEVTQTKTLDATLTTNVVTLATPLLRIFRMRVLANVVSDSPIRVHNAGETVDYAVISIGKNQTLMAVYTVPANKTAYMTNYYATEHPVAGNTATSLNIELWGVDNANGYAKQIKHTVGLAAGGHIAHAFNPYAKFTEKTDIYLDITTVGGTSDMSGGFDLILINN
jgi:hypothetical protein